MIQKQINRIVKTVKLFVSVCKALLLSINDDDESIREGYKLQRI